MGKLMSLETADTGSRWMVITVVGRVANEHTTFSTNALEWCQDTLQVIRAGRVLNMKVAGPNSFSQTHYVFQKKKECY